MRPGAGSLLISSATLVDPNFARSVVLLLDSDPLGGALGVILQRPSETPVGEVLPGWQDMITEPPVLFVGGPVSLDSALGVGLLRDDREPATGWRTLTDTPAGAIGMVDLDSSPEDLVGHLAALRIYAGYAGWGAEQLEGEIEEGSWYVVPAAPADLFSRHPERLWLDVLRRQPAPLSMLATMPTDANLN